MSDRFVRATILESRKRRNVFNTAHAKAEKSNNLAEVRFANATREVLIEMLDILEELFQRPGVANLGDLTYELDLVEGSLEGRLHLEDFVEDEETSHRSHRPRWARRGC